MSIAKITLGTAFLLFTLFATSPLSAMDEAQPDAVTLETGARYVGKFKSVRKGKVVFGDQAAGDIKLGLGQIKSFELHQSSFDAHYQPTRRDELSQGKLTISEGKLVGTDSEGNALDLSKVHRLEFQKYSLWSFAGSVAASLSLSDGNTQETTIGLLNTLDWEHPLHRIGWQAEAQYGEDDGVRTTQRARAQLDYSYRFWTHLGTLVREEVEHDDFKDLEIQSTTTVGLTSPVWEDDDIQVRGEIGLTYTIQRYDSGGEEDFAGGMAALAGKWDVREGMVARASTRLQVNLDETEDSTLQNRLSLGMDLGDGFSLSLNLQHDYDNLPPAGVERNDLRFLALLGYNF